MSTKGTPELEAQLKPFAEWLTARGYSRNSRYVTICHVRRYCREYGELGPTDRAAVTAGSSATHGAAASALRRWSEWRESQGLPYHRLDDYIGTLPHPVAEAVRACTRAGRLYCTAPLLLPTVLPLGLGALCDLRWHPAPPDPLPAGTIREICGESGLSPDDLVMLTVPGQPEGFSVCVFLPARSVNMLVSWGRSGLQGLAHIEDTDPGAIAPPARGAPLLPATPGSAAPMAPLVLARALIVRPGRERSAPVETKKGPRKGAKGEVKKT